MWVELKDFRDGLTAMMAKRGWVWEHRLVISELGSGAQTCDLRTRKWEREVVSLRQPGLYSNVSYSLPLKGGAKRVRTEDDPSVCFLRNQANGGCL